MMLTEGGESTLKTNVNYLLEQFGISANSDCVIRNAFQKYMHPKEVLIEDGVREPSITSTTAQSIVQKASKRKAAKKLDKNATGKLGKGGSSHSEANCAADRTRILMLEFVAFLVELMVEYS